MKNWLLPVAFAGLAACASTPAADVRENPSGRQRALDPVGVFDFTTSFEGTSVVGVLTISRTDTGYAGTVSSNVTEVMPIRAVTVSGSRVEVTADSPDGPLALNMEFAGDEFTGTWALGAMSGTHTGRRRSP